MQHISKAIIYDDIVNILSETRKIFSTYKFCVWMGVFFIIIILQSRFILINI